VPLVPLISVVTQSRWGALKDSALSFSLEGDRQIPVSRNPGGLCAWERGFNNPLRAKMRHNCENDKILHLKIA
jgi:hypothetical protein